MTRDEELEKARLEYLHRAITDYKDPFRAGAAFERKRSEGLVKALEFYANRGNWLTLNKEDVEPDTKVPGKKAREALKQWRNGG